MKTVIEEYFKPSKILFLCLTTKNKIKEVFKNSTRSTFLIFAEIDNNGNGRLHEQHFNAIGRLLM